MKKHSLKEWVLTTRPWSFPASAMPVLVTMAWVFTTVSRDANWLLGLWALVNIVLRNGASSRREALPAGGNATSALRIEPFTIAAGETKELAVSLSNPDDALTLLQFDLTLPEGLRLVKTAGEYMAGMAGRTIQNSHQMNINDNGKETRVLLASSSNALIEGTEGTVIRMTVTATDGFAGGTVTLNGILGVTPDEQEVRMPAAQYRLTGSATGIHSVASGEQDDATVYSLSGQRLVAPKSGINIINGKKIIKK